MRTGWIHHFRQSRSLELVDAAPYSVYGAADENFPSLDPLSCLFTTLHWLSLGFTALVLFRVMYSGLNRTKPFGAFAAMLFTGLMRDLALLCINRDTHAYTVAWEVTLPVLLLAHAWAVMATYQAIARLYPGIGQFAEVLFVGCLVISAMFCFVGLSWEIRRIGGAEASLRSVFLLYQWVDGLAAGGLLLASAFFLRLPAPRKQLPPNLVRHTCLLAAYFTSYAITCFVKTLSPLGLSVWEYAHFTLLIALYAGWALGISAAGERSESWPGLSPEVAAQLREHDAIANKLARYAAK